MWWNRKAQPSGPAVQPEVLLPGECECGHYRCSHVGGKGKCHAMFPPDEESRDWTDCACQIYIRDDDDDSDDDTPEPVDPEVAELNRLSKFMTRALREGR